MLFFIFVCCFFKQKTAYEMRISDWSSDVCSSDLAELVRHDDARDDPHAEHDRKDLQPITVEVGVHALAGFQPQRLEHRQIARQLDRKGREDELEAHREGELRTRENDRIEMLEPIRPTWVGGGSSLHCARRRMHSIELGGAQLWPAPGPRPETTRL